MISFRPIQGGAGGGASLIIKGSGVIGLGGCWRITIGGAGAVIVFGSSLITISPGSGGVGGLKYLIVISCTYSSCCLTLL